MCSFIFGSALTEPILGQYFELPKKIRHKPKVIGEENNYKITDVIVPKHFFFLNKSIKFVIFFIDFCIPIYGYGKICR